MARDPETIHHVPNAQVPQAVADFVSEGATVEVTPDGPGTSTLVATYPDDDSSESPSMGMAPPPPLPEPVPPPPPEPSPPPPPPPPAPPPPSDN